MEFDTPAIIQDLSELIEAIDRRSPQLQRSGEAAILHAAQVLRVQAAARLAELEAARRGDSQHSRHPHEQPHAGRQRYADRQDS
jgi:hypothetical protein